MSVQRLVTGISVDTTRPTAVATASPVGQCERLEQTPNVTVSISRGTDAMSGSGVAGCSASVALSAEGANQPASVKCSDVAGNASVAATASVSIDKTVPSIVVLAPVPNDGFVLGETPTGMLTNARMRWLAWPIVPAQYLTARHSIHPASAIGPSQSRPRDRAGNAASASRGYFVNPPGTVIITTVAGSGTYEFSGDGGPATSAGIGFRWGSRWTPVVIFMSRIKTTSASAR